ncbi:BINDING PROTEIN putative-RELATED [Salix koriyanagi]|uniref:BINDING PROTEIN putative-RELATED n=1 Tax=Salix koriyanagi TaxID=2511006 RepID=A0A9Q1AEA7_9ROSI|nr:BINDING PROTEIN putative-RELATED [Salix koriyanagi]
MGLTRIKHPSHSHHYLCLLKLPQEPYWCNGCMGLGFGPCYECEHEGCGFYLHEECANAAPSISHPFSKCSLKFHYNAPQGDERYCDACGEDVLGFVYQCSHKHPHDYHPRCLKLPRTLTAGDGLILQLRKKLPSKCLRCGSKETSNRIQGWCYVSSSDRYCYHIACVKDMILEKWRKGYFTQDGDVNDANNLELQTFNPSREIALPGGRSSSKASQIWRKAATVIMVIISALFGDPSALISVLVQYWLSS